MTCVRKNECACGTVNAIEYEPDEHPDFDYAGWLEFETEKGALRLWNNTQKICEHGCCIRVECVSCEALIDTQKGFPEVEDDDSYCPCFDGVQERCLFDVPEGWLAKLYRTPGTVVHNGVV